MDTIPDADEVARKYDALGTWEKSLRYNWAVKLAGVAFPYFCTSMAGDGKEVRYRLLMIEGWENFYFCVKLRQDSDFGFYTTPMELPHIELVSYIDGDVRLFRHRPGYVPQPLADADKPLAARILWQCYGVMMRIESDDGPIMKYADEHAMFGRLETSPGVWRDNAFPIWRPRPYVENIRLPADLVAKAKSIPLSVNLTVELDFYLVHDVISRDEVPRCCYRLAAASEKYARTVFCLNLGVSDEMPLKELWESIPARILAEFVKFGRVPGEIKVSSMRMFRYLRPIGMEIPFRISLHSHLPAIARMH